MKSTAYLHNYEYCEYEQYNLHIKGYEGHCLHNHKYLTI